LFFLLFFVVMTKYGKKHASRGGGGRF
jgi:hypothetical protein